MGSIFITYGAKAGGGPPFLKRQRSAVGQLQTRTRTGSTTNQLQTRTRTCYCNTTTTYGYTNYGYTGDCGYYSGSECPPPYIQSYNGCDYCFIEEYYYSWYGSGPCSQVGCSGTTYNYCYFYYCYGPIETTTCYQSSWTGWSNTSSCSAVSYSCEWYDNGRTSRECRTVSACSFGDWTAWSNTSSCTASAPSCSSGAVQRECQTVYNWGEWSEWEEAETCTPQSPTLGAGAVEIECQPN